MRSTIASHVPIGLALSVVAMGLSATSLFTAVQADQDRQATGEGLNAVCNELVQRQGEARRNSAKVDALRRHVVRVATEVARNSDNETDRLEVQRAVARISTLDLVTKPPTRCSELVRRATE